VRVMGLDASVKPAALLVGIDARHPASGAQPRVAAGSSRTASSPTGRLVDGPCPLWHARGRGSSSST
jgi:hypothetical protein